MISDDSTPSRIVGGGINTSESEQPVVVTQMLGIASSDPVREEVLRARFLSFDPLFDVASSLVAHQLVLRGRAAGADAPPELRQMEEDMLLTGLYSLTQDGLTGELPLLVRISTGMLFSEVPQQLNHRQLIWCVNLDNEQHLARALALQDAGLTFCPTLNPQDAVVQDSLSAWRYLACNADDTPPAVAARLIVDGVRHAHAQARWPGNTWFRGSFFSGDTQPAEISHEQAVQLDLLAIALRESVETLVQFFRLNPDMAPRLLAIANSQAGGLSRPAGSTAHALIMLGSQRAGRVAALLALAGRQPTESSRHYAITALTRALFMGKITRLGAPAESAAAAFEIGLLSTAPLALSLPVETLIRKLGLSATSARALSAHPSPEGAMLQLTYACENNDVETLASYAQQLDIPLHQISVAYLDALIAASELDAALH
ncbi:MAG: HDOD domain-containing protein [Thiobacillus sp.]|uniref:EAL and HDOD domain-containing protein n=1 Tax=unclassified Thiobacillus TaxID=2646513 RepID=UPI00086CC551|nr:MULTISPECIES: HDOD domain-containing protein [unclassified Thiobacillus]MBN8772300.1 HDOD domain-containing protein [Thiobacillus sp.]MBN8779692.1 HDOD domain-containing protein [Thiobacillus sp.]ODU99987.1 MAG: signal transduction protein [Thiobacillus sp. SCN 63-57]